MSDRIFINYMREKARALREPAGPTPWDPRRIANEIEQLIEIIKKQEASK